MICAFLLFLYLCYTPASLLFYVLYDTSLHLSALQFLDNAALVVATGYTALAAVSAARAAGVTHIIEEGRFGGLSAYLYALHGFQVTSVEFLPLDGPKEGLRMLALTSLGRLFLIKGRSNAIASQVRQKLGNLASNIHDVNYRAANDPSVLQLAPPTRSYVLVFSAARGC